MYLVELRPGKEELYRTTEDLAAAIRKGDVDVHSRIYHRATSKWISVTLHPQYKAIVSERPAPPPLPPLERSTWTFFNDSADSLAGANDPSPDDQADGGDGKPNSTDSDHPWRRPLALSITGGLLILGLQLAAAGQKPPWAAHEPTATQANVVAPVAMPPAMPAGSASQASAPTISLANSGARWTDRTPGYAPSTSSTEGATVPAPAAESTPAKSAFLLPTAPRIRTSGLLKAVAATTTASTPAPAPDGGAPTIRSFVARWTAAHDSALARLESGVRVARLSQLFASSRLTPGGGVTETRMSLAGVANFVRIYRLQQAAIERQYQESFQATSKARGWTPAELKMWYAKPVRAESPAVATLTASLIEGIDSLLGVLDAQAGTYAVTKNTIRFEDPAAAREYMALREQIMVTMDSAKVAGAADHPGPMSYLLQAIGATRLPIAS